MIHYEPFLTDIIYPGALLNALCHPVILNHARLDHKQTSYRDVRRQKQSLNCGLSACVDECNGTDKGTKNKPDVIFLGVYLESCFFLWLLS